MYAPASLQKELSNRLLDALCGDERERFFRHLEPVRLCRGEVLYKNTERPSYAYFPTSSIISSLFTTKDGTNAQVGLIGNKGVVGMSVILSNETMPYWAIVQIAGKAFRVTGDVLAAEFARGGQVQKLLLRYTQALMTQLAQTALCNRLHNASQRLCSSLLLCCDRTGGGEQLPLTQELLAEIVGVRREAVTVAAGQLQEHGLIKYCRGRIRITDRRGLEACACECYSVIALEYGRLVR